MTYNNPRFYVGQQDVYEKLVTEEDVLLFAEVSGDLNPVHINREFAKNSIFRGQIAHGLFIASLISKVIGMQMPGNGTIYLSQNCKFLKPAYIGDNIKVVVEITELGAKNRATLSTKVFNQNEELILDGEAKVLLPKANS